MEKHIKVLGALHIAYAILVLLAAIVVFIAVAGGGQIADDPDVEQITAGLGTATAGLIAIFALPSLVGGIGLINHKSWAWVLVLIAGIMSLLSFPIGTAIGVYTIWVLTRPETKTLLTR